MFTVKSNAALIEKLFIVQYLFVEKSIKAKIIL